MKHDRNTHLNYILRILMGVCVIGIIYFGFLLFLDNHEYDRGDDAYQEIRQIWESSDESYILGNGSSHTNDKVQLEEMAEEQSSRVDFTSLREINTDVVGWLVSEDGEISYPMVKGKDNDFYLNHLFNGESNKLGAIFMDYRNNKDYLDKNTLIYGHNMKNGSMFSSLTKYKEQSYYDRYPTMLLYTPMGNFSIELFAGLVLDGNDESVRLVFKDEHDFQRYIELIRLNSTFKSDRVVEADDRIITLCTCSNEFNNARYALYGRLKPSMKVFRSN